MIRATVTQPRLRMPFLEERCLIRPRVRPTFSIRRSLGSGAAAPCRHGQIERDSRLAGIHSMRLSRAARWASFHPPRAHLELPQPAQPLRPAKLQTSANEALNGPKSDFRESSGAQSSRRAALGLRALPPSLEVVAS